MKNLLYTNGFIEWCCRVLFTTNIVLSGLNYDDSHNYPFNALLLVLGALWLYFFNLKIVSLLPLLLALFINYLHIGVSPF